MLLMVMMLYVIQDRIPLNNEAKFKALNLGLISTLHIQGLCVQGDFRLIIKGEFAHKEIALVAYQTTVQKLMKSFQVFGSTICLKLIESMLVHSHLSFQRCS